MRIGHGQACQLLAHIQRRGHLLQSGPQYLFDGQVLVLQAVCQQEGPLEIRLGSAEKMNPWLFGWGRLICFQGFGSVGSRSLFVGGTAVAVSTVDLIAKAREKAAEMLETSVEDIEYGDGWLTIAGTDRRVSLFEIAKVEQDARLSVDSAGEVDGPSWPNGVHICEVEIDPETGITTVVRYTTVDDVGVAVNPMLVAGQVHGGVAQGIGQALYEGVAYSPEGQLLTASFQDYCIPRASDLPSIAVTLDDSAPCRTNPLGAKGCGESGAIGGPPCITNGVMDALGSLGIRSLATPLTPAKIWQAIQEAGARAG